MASSGDREERRHLTKLKELCVDFPEGELKFAAKGEKPDLIVKGPKKMIGVEHTRLFHPPSDRGLIRQEQESLRAQAVAKAKQMFETKSDLQLDVAFHFNDTYGLAVDPSLFRMTSAKVDSIAQSLADFVINHVPNVNDWKRIDRYQYRDEIPVEVRSVDMFRQPDQIEGLWQSPEGGVLARLTPSFLQDAIDRKETKYDDYRKKCNTVWLMMAASGWSISSAFDLEQSQGALEHTYVTRFERVFVLMDFDRHLSELNVVSPTTT